MCNLLLLAVCDHNNVWLDFQFRVKKKKPNHRQFAVSLATLGRVLCCVSESKNFWFVLQYIQQNIRSDCSNIDKILEPPEGQDEGVWKYEHLRYEYDILIPEVSLI